ncbi:GNAT family N-acetyltransferase [Vibrio cholerae]|uniref:GNAT family N-acetyltransferase n=1 Tax=Vibrio cholerae TaxID=666 RepID=UPI0011D6F145|nr:GNAT family N-acetyltransferase [Vibrio cholerae]EGR2427916.1 GNAT family N-acetyltransferase [Vibrio cholerae]ELU9847989.1 GNAT family N-acetyltransferase [Vibrio cholerae]ELV3247185.1 GNAT family N-acetyltransferase [Vibrio cholerae]MDV2320536.1 GNAT family N-acetyltransferase [Vibrio cholerae]TXZ71249.1 GNAT family N-acetyltransferase [Vibrio cholerae]
MRVEIVPIRPEFDAEICHIIQSVGAEFGAIGEGFGPSDAEVLAMSQHYREQDRSAYFVALLEGKVVGGGGIAPFAGHKDLCELKKLFLLPTSRGHGVGRALSEHCLNFAKQQGYAKCYLDTLSSMTQAIKLYQQLGFEHLTQPMAGTEHNGCDVWMLKSLN